MATVVKAHVAIKPGSNVYETKWEGLNTIDQDGDPIEFPGAAERSVHVFGTFDGMTVTLEGSNEPGVDGAAPVGANWAALHDVVGDAISFTTKGVAVIAENVRWIRPVSTGGTSPDVDVILLSKAT
jgi:hypothetical protein